MTKKSMQLLAVPALLAIVFAIFSFTTKDKEIVNGGGIAEGNHFDFTAVQSGSDVVGHFSWNGTPYDITCVVMGDEGLATIYLSDNMAVNVTDVKHGTDIITAPYEVESGDCGAEPVNADLIEDFDVTEGNLTVHN